MVNKSRAILGITALFIFVSSGLVLSEDMNVQGGAVPEAQTESEPQWAWGEVISVDAANKTFTLKFLDYETDTEKDLTISVDEKTTYENIKSLEEIAVKDVLNVDYIITPDGQYIARDVSLEILEGSQSQAPAAEQPAKAITTSAPTLK